MVHLEWSLKKKKCTNLNFTIILWAPKATKLSPRILSFKQTKYLLQKLPNLISSSFFHPFWAIFIVMSAPTGSPQCLFQIHRQPISKNFKFSDIGLSTLPNNDYFNGKFHFLWLLLNLKNMFSKCKMGFSTHKKNHHFCEIELFLKAKQVP